MHINSEKVINFHSQFNLTLKKFLTTYISTQVFVLREIRVVKINLRVFQQSSAIASLNLRILFDGYIVHFERATSSPRIKVSFGDRNSHVLCIIKYDIGAGMA